LAELLDQIADIDADDPIEIVLEIEKRMRPDISGNISTTHIALINKYYAAMKHACEVFGIPSIWVCSQSTMRGMPYICFN